MTEEETKNKEAQGEAAALAAIALVVAGGGDVIPGLEALVTPRRMREALLGYVGSGCFVQTINKAINAQRGGE